jgi:sugar porter (SP) family MFS transporter
MIPSLILAIGILFCPFSPRWLISHDREDEARNVLSKIRSASHDEIKEELNRIRNEVARFRESEIESYHQLFRSPLLRPFLLGIGIQVLQQLTGINSTIYYAPRILMRYSSKTDYDGSFINLQNSFLVTGIYGCVNAAATLPTMIFIDKLGRRKLLISGALIMSISMLIVAILDRIYEKNQSEDFTYNNPIFIIISVFLSIFIGAFALSWGPVPWIYCTEIFPLTMRAKATSITTAVNWATNCGISFLVPTLLYHLQYGLFIIFSLLCAMMIAVVYLFYPETRGTHLEDDSMNERDRIFVPKWAKDTRKNFHEQIIVTQENSINRSNEINNNACATK